jgi:hypothetical protein
MELSLEELPDLIRTDECRSLVTRMDAQPPQGEFHVRSDRVRRDDEEIGDVSSREAVCVKLEDRPFSRSQRRDWPKLGRPPVRLETAGKREGVRGNARPPALERAQALGETPSDLFRESKLLGSRPPLGAAAESDGAQWFVLGPDPEDVASEDAERAREVILPARCKHAPDAIELERLESSLPDLGGGATRRRDEVEVPVAAEKADVREVDADGEWEDFGERLEKVAAPRF